MGYLVTQTANVVCMHGGQGQPIAVSPRLQIDKQPVILQTSNYTIAGCSNIPEAGGPCASGQWLQGAVRVKSQGMPLLLNMSQGVCAPTGVKLTVVMTQLRVQAL